VSIERASTTTGATIATGPGGAAAPKEVDDTGGDGQSDMKSPVEAFGPSPITTGALVDTLAAGRFRGEQQLQDYLELIAKENLRLSQLIEKFLGVC